MKLVSFSKLSIFLSSNRLILLRGENHRVAIHFALNCGFRLFLNLILHQNLLYYIYLLKWRTFLLLNAYNVDLKITKHSYIKISK